MERICDHPRVGVAVIAQNLEGKVLIGRRLGALGSGP
jgi:hypothetical protein